MYSTVTREQSVEMYARFMTARQGSKASKIARAKAELLAKNGDLEGHKIWSEVADAADATQILVNKTSRQYFR
jgi:hypothetical protein